MVNDLKTLKEITVPIFEDINLFEMELSDALNSEVRLVNTIGKYILRHKGNHIKYYTYWYAIYYGLPSKIHNANFIQKNQWN